MVIRGQRYTYMLLKYYHYNNNDDIRGRAVGGA